MEKRELVETIDKPEELEPGTGVAISDDTKYEYGASLETEPTHIIDPAKGKTVVLRSFDFVIPPNINLKDFPKDKQKIFNDHAGLIKTTLWSDGLIPYEGSHEVSPKVVIDLKERKFKIIVVAQARLNTMFIEKPESLSKMLSSTASKRGTSRHQK